MSGQHPAVAGQRPVGVRSFVAWVARDPVASQTPESTSWRTWSRERLAISWQPSATGRPHDPASAPALILGDDSEWDSRQAELNLAGGVPVRFDGLRNRIVVQTSIVGLPPVFVYRGTRITAIASDIHLLAGLPNVDLELNPESVQELGRIGHPVGHRTLFRGISLVPSGATLTLDADGSISVRETWTLPEQSPLAWPEFIETQIAAFRDSLRRTDLSGAFLSLTAGLDTRTVLAELAAQSRLVPGATMTGPKRSLDIRTAARLCEAYGVAHHAITFDDRFTRELPRFVEIASRLSGGLASLDQAPEVFLYSELGGRYTTRLSGNLGNQVGRGGTEGVSTRSADIGILASALRAPSSDARASGHWLLDQLETGSGARTEFILKNEIPFTLVNNFTIGSNYARQLTPYASRALIETLSARPPAGATSPSGSMIRMRLRDLAHRFLGEPEAFSFQRTLLRRADGFAAHYPINWGWRAAGGVSPKGLVMGSATLFGMYARARGLDGGILRRPLAWTGLPALHDFRESRAWLRTTLREFTLDTLGSGRAAALFDRAALGRVIDAHFSGRADRYATITFALDVALADRTFCINRGT
jgi:hypothetical protein